MPTLAENNLSSVGSGTSIVHSGTSMPSTASGYTFAHSGALIDSCSDLQKFYAAEKQMIDYPIDENIQNPFIWPVDATRISTYYHDEDYFKVL